jgi:hypothetical protein
MDLHITNDMPFDDFFAAIKTLTTGRVSEARRFKEGFTFSYQNVGDNQHTISTENLTLLLAPVFYNGTRVYPSIICEAELDGDRGGSGDYYPDATLIVSVNFLPEEQTA